ncbi:MAG: hypothetical protein LPK47_03445 [Bacteroidota bacterium]|nr:hypothetical protein [Bacteroidota bacterium]
MNHLLFIRSTLLGLFLAPFLFACNPSGTDLKTEKKDTLSSSMEGIEFKEDFELEERTLVTSGRNPFFILEPGYVLEFAGMEGDDSLSLVITVLEDTMKVGTTWTRVVEERELENGELVEISRNYFAIDLETRDVLYFGEEVDIYEDGVVTTHSGAWLAEGENKPGLIMPGSPVIGKAYYQEIAPGIAMDRAMIMDMDEKFVCPAGTFTQVLRTNETSPLEPGSLSEKLYAPEIGLVMDGELNLVRYGLLDPSIP